MLGIVDVDFQLRGFAALGAWGLGDDNVVMPTNVLRPIKS